MWNTLAATIKMLHPGQTVEGDYPCEYYCLWRLSLWALLLCSVTRCDITMGNDIARDIHCDITISNDIARIIHCDITRVMTLLGMSIVTSQSVIALLCVYIMTSQCTMALLWASFIMYYYFQLLYCCFPGKLFKIIHSTLKSTPNQ